MKRSLMTVLGLAVASVWAAPAFAQDAKVARGAELFTEQKCTVCHAVAGKGNVKRPLDGVGSHIDAATAKLWLTDPKAAVEKTGKKGPLAMKSFATLPAADIDALVAYVLSLK
jgi:mono/diheme cytochrome c family protein